MRVSVTELLTWRHCQRLHAFKYKERLEPKVRNEHMASGTSVHKSIEHTLLALRGGLESYDVKKIRDSFAETFLLQEFEHEERGEELAMKYTRGVRNALDNAPAWLWKLTGENVFIEHPLELRLEADLIVHGRPDLFHIDPEHKIVELLEFKTTAKDPGKYLLWNPQHRLYCLMLSAMYPDHGIQFRYVTLPTQGKAPAELLPWRFNHKVERATADYLGQLVREMRETTAIGYTSPNVGWHCDFCDFNKICAAIETGGDASAAKAEGFKERERRA